MKLKVGINQSLLSLDAGGRKKHGYRQIIAIQPTREQNVK